MGFFKAYDLRGTFGTDFGLDTVRRVGRALPQVVKGRRWLVGRDGRTTSDAVRTALVSGLVDAGASVTDLGLVTTPMVYFFTARGDFDGSVMVTASHNPPTDNGLKVSMRTALPVGYANGLDEVERLIGLDTSPASSADSGVPAPVGTDPDALAVYLAWMRGEAPFDLAASGLRIAVDCSNGMASLFARELFPGAVLLNDVIDGAFPAHSPNPLKAEARADAAAAVRAHGLDAALIFDGDADRCMFLDERGEFVQPDYLIPVVAEATRARHPATAGRLPVVLHDVRTSRGAIETLRERGFEPAMVPVGHAFAKPQMRERDALCGGELAGHYYFGAFFGCDSGVLAALRVLGALAAAKARGETFSQLMRPIAGRYANSGERNFRVADKDAAIARMLAAATAFGPERGRSEIDGVRVEFDEGWINVRKSNTEPYLRLVVEARAPERLAAWLAALEKAADDAR